MLAATPQRTGAAIALRAWLRAGLLLSTGHEPNRRWYQQAPLPSCKLRAGIHVVALTRHARAVSSYQLESRQLVHPHVPATHLLEGLQLRRLLQLLSFLLELLLLQDLVHKLQLVLVQRPVLACSGGAPGQSMRQ